MIKLNLVDLEKSDLKYKISKFPDGQQTVDLTEWKDLDYTDPVKITSRLNSFKDLELIICAVGAIRNIKPNKDIFLHVPYFLGSRSDRKFVEGGVNYLKQVICPIINSLNFTCVIVLDPHSDVLEACLNNYEKVSNDIVVEHSLLSLASRYTNPVGFKPAIVSPDAGALKKIYDVAKNNNIEKVITASKVRDIKTSKIVKTELPETDWAGISDVLIIDDICDGGRTFIELAKAIRESGFIGTLSLVVSHGIFSAGLKPLNEHFDYIFTTNSVVDQNDPEFSLKNDNELHKLVQFNVVM
jgi:ribose-phosphate pyrophosphokinase